MLAILWMSFLARLRVFLKAVQSRQACLRAQLLAAGCSLKPKT